MIISKILKGSALGVAKYGQMTAGGWMYIGPQTEIVLAPIQPCLMQGD